MPACCGCAPAADDAVRNDRWDRVGAPAGEVRIDTSFPAAIPSDVGRSGAPNPIRGTEPENLPMRLARTLVLPLLAVALAASCAGRREMAGPEASDLDPRLSKFVYIEGGNLVDLVVATKATRYRDGEPFVPIEIAVANRGLKQLSMTRESFVLLDADGNRYPAAGPTELRESYPFLDMDQRLGELESVLRARYAAFTRHPGSFSPSRTVRRGSSGVVHRQVSLPRFGYMIDMLYFPTPSTGVKNRRFELFLWAPELPDPVFVRFEVL